MFGRIKQRGFTLFELLVVLFILTLFCLGGWVLIHFLMKFW